MRKLLLFVLLVPLGVLFVLAQPALTAMQRAERSTTPTPVAVNIPIVSGCQAEPPDCADAADETPTPPATAVSTAVATAAATATATGTPDSAPDITRVNAGGLGFSDVGARQVVRTSTDRVYLFVPEIYKAFMHAYRATTSGTPAGFAEPDQAHWPTAASSIWAIDAAIDANDRVQVVYLTEAGPIYATTFDTASDRWGTPALIADSVWPNRNNGIRQGSAGVSLALDASGVAHVVYGKTQSATRRVYYNNNQGGTWNHETVIDDQPEQDNSHATLAFGPNGTLYVAWLADDGTKGALRMRSRTNGTWGTTSLIDDNAFREDQYSIDQGPSLLVAIDGRVHVAYIGPYEPVANAPTGYAYGRAHHKYSGNGGADWTSDDPPERYTHDPALATDGQGNLYMFGHRESWKANGCADMLVVTQPAAGSWDTWRVFAKGCYDSSVSTKWSQYHWNMPAVLDVIYWTEKGPQGQADYNELRYAEIRGGSAAINTLPEAGGP